MESLQRTVVRIPGGNPNLTDREYELLAYIAQGHSRSEATQHFNIQYTTLKTHIRNMYSKLYCESLHQLVSWYWMQ